jgi:hypothetical protein
MFLTISGNCHSPVSGPFLGLVSSWDIVLALPPETFAIMHWQHFWSQLYFVHYSAMLIIFEVFPHQHEAQVSEGQFPPQVSEFTCRKAKKRNQSNLIVIGFFNRIINQGFSACI